MTIDLIGMLGNLSQSLYPVQHLITGGAYVLGILFIVTALFKLKKVGSSNRSAPSQEKMYGVAMYFLMGSACLFLPTVLVYLANTAFGGGSALKYAPFNKNNFYSTVVLLIRTAGLLWFVRGCVLLAHASQAGSKLGSKGLSFIAAGILAMNLDNTIAVLNWIVFGLIKLSGFIKPT